MSAPLRRLQNKKGKKAAFLGALRGGATVTDACRAAGITRRRTAYDWRKEDADFAADWDDATQEGVDALLREARRRAINGTEKLVLYKGSPILVDAVTGAVIEKDELSKYLDGKCASFLVEKTYSDAILMFLLKAREPLTYCDRARTAKLLRKWAKQDSKEGKGQADEFAPVADVLEALARAANAKAQSAE